MVICVACFVGLFNYIAVLYHRTTYIITICYGYFWSVILPPLFKEDIGILYHLKFCLVDQISYNDRPNAELIMESRRAADLVIRSVDFSS